MRRGLRSLPTALLLLVSSMAHAAFDCPLVEGTEGGDRIPLIFAAAGYAEADKALYEADVQSAIEAFLKEPPFSSYRGHFTFYRAWTPSLRSRVPDQPSDSSFGRIYMGPVYPMWDEDYFFANFRDTHSICRGKDLLFLVNNRVVFLVNSYMGGRGVNLQGGKRVFCERGRNSTVLHELGHSLGELSDEYGGFPTWSSTTWRPDGTPYGRVFNVTRSLAKDSIPWKDWIEDSVPLPTEPSSKHQGAVGAFEGGDYRDVGVYRPELSCLMRSYAPFCRVCRESLVSHILSYTSRTFFNKISLDTVFPVPSASRWDSAAVSGGKVVVRRIPGDTVAVGLRWKFRGQWLAGVRETLDVATLSGSGPLEAVLEGSSPFIRNLDLVARDTFYWSVRRSAGITSLGGSDARIRRIGPALFEVPSGAEIPQWARDNLGRRIPLRVVATTSEGRLVGAGNGFTGILFLEADNHRLDDPFHRGSP